MFPTHKHSPQFWEHLGRAVATFGFLEEVLAKAIFAFTATREYPEEDIEDAYQAWLPQLERALTASLKSLARAYGKAAKENPKCRTQNIDELVARLEKAADLRNVLAHASWNKAPDDNGASVPRFVNRDKLSFDDAVDIDYLKRIQIGVADLACSVMDTVTHMGHEFPGSAGPGKPIT
jgi:hypothetical protein